MNRKKFVWKLASRDRRAWEEFVREYGALIYSISGKMGLDGGERDDHFQEVCISALKGIESLRDPERLASWIYNIARRRAIDLLRKRRDEASLPENEESPHASLRIEAVALDALLRMEERAQILDGLAALDERCRRLLNALFLEDPAPGYEMIGDRLGLPVGSIGPTRARCLEKLENRLGKLSDGDLGPSTGSKTGASNRSRRGGR